MALIAMGTWKKIILKIAPCDASGGKPGDQVKIARQQNRRRDQSKR